MHFSKFLSSSCLYLHGEFRVFNAPRQNQVNTLTFLFPSHPTFLEAINIECSTAPEMWVRVTRQHLIHGFVLQKYVSTTCAIFLKLYFVHKWGRGVEVYAGEASMLVWDLLFFLAVPCGLRDLCSPTRDWTRAPCSGSVESQPLDRQGSGPSLRSSYLSVPFVFLLFFHLSVTQ